MGGFLLGIDAGSSSVKVTILNAEKGNVVASASYPEKEMEIISLKPGWAEQHPDTWWTCLKNALSELRSASGKAIGDIRAIGISYQMHGLVTVNKQHKVLRPAIIWCDSRAVEIGERAFHKLGENQCLEHLLNSPGNFTASKLKWVKDHEPLIYKKISRVMLPGDYIAMKMTGEVYTTISGLSEGILWDYKDEGLANQVIDHYDIEMSMIPPVLPTFSIQGQLIASAAKELGLRPGIPISYRAGDQPNNAFSLNVLKPGEVAATAGTSGVVYGIINEPRYDPQSRVNTFVHVNHNSEKPSYGVLLCINGTGILNSWLKHQTGGESYDLMNRKALLSGIGAKGLVVLPFGNGAERVLGNRNINAQILGLNFNMHKKQDLYRASQEGIAFALKYGFDVMQKMGMKMKVVRAGKANMFLSPLFREAFVNTTGAIVELINTDGSQGAARGAGVGAGIYKDFKQAFTGLKTLARYEHDQEKTRLYKEAYKIWLKHLNKQLI